MKDMIVKLKEEGKTVVMCSHLLADVQDVCDRIAILDGGELKVFGKVQDLLKDQGVTQIKTSRLAGGRHKRGGGRPGQTWRQSAGSRSSDDQRSKICSSGRCARARRGPDRDMSPRRREKPAASLRRLLQTGRDDFIACRFLLPILRVVYVAEFQSRAVRRCRGFDPLGGRYAGRPGGGVRDDAVHFGV